MKKTKMIVFLGLMIALNVVLSRFLSVSTGFIRIGVAFIPVVVASMVCGPVLGGVAAALGDILGFFIFPTGGGYIPGITLGAFLGGLAFGLILRRHAPSLLRSFAAAAVVCLLVEAGINSLFLYFAIPGVAFSAVFVSRLILNLIMIPIEAFAIYGIGRALERPDLKKWLN